MEIHLQGVSKRFTGSWIFQNVNYSFKEGKSYAITGPNGSGKSTLLLIISGWILPNQGTIEFLNHGKLTDPAKIYESIDIAATYLELIEELTLREFVDFHFRFNFLRGKMTNHEFIKNIDLEEEQDKFIRHFSSGMKQRLKLGLGLFSSNQVLLLDEPTSNLDQKGKEWFDRIIKSLIGEKLIIVASNQPDEYDFCDDQLKIMEFK